MKRTYTPIDFNKPYESTREMYARFMRQLEDNRANFERAARAVRPFSRMMHIGLSVAAGQLTINAYVAAMDEVAPLIEELQEALGVEFDKSEDHVLDSFAYRTFECKDAPWLRVDANLQGDSDACRRVQVGEKVVPVYELRCGGDSPAL